MIFGDKNFFAVEIQLDENYGGEWLFGKICYWIRNVQIGNFTESITLRDVLSMMRWIIYDAGNRDGSSFCSLPANQAFTEIDNLIYGDLDRDDEHPSNLIETVVHFDASIKVSVFFEVKIYLMQCGNRDRLIYKITNCEEVEEILLDVGVFDNVINQVYMYLDNLHESELTFSHRLANSQ